MQCLEHPVEKLRSVLFSTCKDLIDTYEQYSRAEKRFLEGSLLPGSSFFTAITTNNLQLHAGDLLTFLKKKKHKDAFCIVGITMIDLYPKDSWNFVFGQASLREGMGVFSFYTSNYAGKLKRTVKLKPGDYSVFQDYYTPPITSTLLLCSCKALLQWIEKESSAYPSDRPTEAFQDFRQWLCKCMSILEDDTTNNIIEDNKQNT